MNTYIFLTTEGYTFQPDSDSIEPDIENLQVLGIASGLNQEEAFSNLLRNHPYLVNTNFTETFCYQMNNDYLDSKKYFCLTVGNENDK